TRTGATLFSYLNAVTIEEYDPSITLLGPTNLTLEPGMDRLSITLTWTDRTNNESASGGYEVQRAEDSLFNTGLASFSLPANTTSYKSIWLALNKKYWYRVRAKNGSSYSGFSNRAASITPSRAYF